MSLSGVINYLDVNNPDQPLQVLMGHNKPITSLALHPERHTVYTASHDGTVTQWNCDSGKILKWTLEKRISYVNAIKVNNKLPNNFKELPPNKFLTNLTQW